MKGHKKQRCVQSQTLILEDGAIYNGSVYDAKPSGHGTIDHGHYTYVGQFIEGKKHGYGIETHVSSRKYDGYWECGLYHGNGSIYYETGSSYTGQFRHGLYDGHGTILNSDSSYTGQWSNGTRHGNGTHTLPRGTYSGSFYYDVRHGDGMYTNKDGEMYSGQWRRGLRAGRGVYTTKDGSYTGQWRNDRQSGQGRWVSECHGIYQGQWKRGKRHYTGTQTSKDGTIYEGSWLYGQKSGSGLERAVTGLVYCGLWLKDMYNGNGLLTVDGHSYNGCWSFGKRGDMFVETRPDGTRSTGPWLNDRRHGTFIEGEVRQLYIWNKPVQLTLKKARACAIRLMEQQDCVGAAAVLEYFPSLLSWSFFWKYDIEGVNVHLFPVEKIITILKKRCWTLFRASRYIFLSKLMEKCPADALLVATRQVPELFDAITLDFVANPWIVQTQSYSESTKTTLLEGLHLGDFGRCPPKDPFTRLTLTSDSGSYLRTNMTKAKAVYLVFMDSIGLQPTVRELSYSFDMEDFEEILKNARETNDRETIKKIMKERANYMQNKN